MPTVTLDPDVPPNTGESPGLGASRIRALTQAVLDLLGLPANTAITAPLAATRVGPLTNRTGGALAITDLVALDAANDASVVLDDVAGSPRTFVVATGTIANGATGMFVQAGDFGVHTFGPVTRGHYLRKSASTGGAAEDTGVAQASGSPPSGAFGVAMSATASVGNDFVRALLWGFTLVETSVVAVSSGASAAANTAALQAAHDALPATGGEIRIATYGIHINAAINITKPCKIVGPGTTEVSTPGTFVLYLDTASQVGFNVTAKGPFIMQDMSISGAASSNPIKIDGPTGTLKGTESVCLDNVVFYGGGIHVDIRAAIFFRITRCLFFNYTSSGVKVQNTLDADQGDSSIEENCVFSGPQTANVYGVLYLSGGGLKIRGCKFLGNDAGIAVDPTPGASDPNTISDLIIDNCSIEGFNSSGIYLTRTSGALVPSQIHITNCQITVTTGAGTVGILIAPASGTAYDYVIINGNFIRSIAIAIQLRGVTNVMCQGNVIEVSGAVFDVNSTVINVTAGPNAYIAFGASFIAGTPGDGFLLVGGGLLLTVAQLPLGIEQGSMAYATNALGPGDGGYTAGMTATAGGSGAFVYRQSGAWKA